MGSDNHSSDDYFLRRIISEIDEAVARGYVEQRSLAARVQNSLRQRLSAATNPREGAEQKNLVRANLRERQIDAIGRCSHRDGVTLIELPHRDEFIETSFR